MDHRHAQPVKQILAKLALAHGRLQVAMGGGDDANVQGDGLFAADSLEAALLQDPQELDLGGRACRSPISSRKIVPRCACSKRPMPAASAPGERSAFMAEQFAFQKVLGNRRAIDRHERFIARSPCW